MNAPSANREPLQQPGAVYLLPHLRQPRFKVGWSVKPSRRVRLLPESVDRELDLGIAQVAWFRQSNRARQVERALHRGLAPYGVDVGHGGDGRTEWFHLRGIALARQMLVMLAASEVALGRSPLRGIDQLPRWEQRYADETENADGVWSHVEDLWWRLATYLPLTVNVREAEIRLKGLKPLQLTETYLLQSHVVNLETYQWCDEGRRRSLVRFIDWEGDDLLLRLTPPAQLRKWPGAEAMGNSLQTFLLQQADAALREARPPRRG